MGNVESMKKTEGGRRTAEGRRRRAEGGGHGDPSSAVRRPPSVLRRLFKWGLLTVAGFLLLIIMLWGVIQTPWAKSRLQDLVAHITADTGDYQVRLQGLDGLLPFSITLKGATISDEKGAWLKMEHFDFAVAPLALIRGRVLVKWLRMDHLAVLRLPTSQKPAVDRETPEKETTPLSLPPVLVREIGLKRIDLGKALAGKPMAFTLGSRLETEENRISVNTLLKDLNHADNALKLNATYDLSTQNLKAKLAYHEDKGGLVAGLSGLTDLENIQLTADADGSLSHMQGDLDLHMGGYGKSRLNYEIENGKKTSLELKGRMTVDARIVPSGAAGVMTSPNIDVILRASMSPENKVLLKQLDIKNNDTSIALEGTCDLKKERLDLRAQIDGIDPGPFLKGTGIALSDPGPVHITAVGPFMAPEVHVSTKLAGFTTREATLTGTDLTLRALFLKGFTGLKNATLALHASKVRMQQAPKLRGPLNLDIDAKTPDFSAWQVKSLKAALPGVDILASDAFFDLSKVHFSGDLTVHADHVADLLPPDAKNLDGNLQLNAKVNGTGPKDLKARLTLVVSKLKGLPPEAMTAAGPKVSLTAKAQMKGDRLALESAKLKASQAELTASGWMDLKERTFDVAYQMGLDNSGSNPSKVALPVGDIQSQGRITGAFDGFAAEVTLASQHLQMNELDMDQMKTRISARGLPQKPVGSIRLEATAMAQPLSVKSDFGWNGKTLSVKDAAVQMTGLDLTAALDLTPKTKGVSGTVNGKITSLEMVRALTGMAVKGNGTFQIEAGNTLASNDKPALTLVANLKDLKYQDYGAAALKMNAHVDNLKEMRGGVRLEASDIPLGNSHLETFNLDVKGSLSGAEIALKAKGSTVTDIGKKSQSPLFLTTKARVMRTDQWKLRVDALKGGYEDLKINLQKPVNLAYRDDGQVLLDDLQLKMDKGLISAKAEVDRENVAARIRIVDMPLSLLEPFLGQELDGRVELDLNLSGPLADPGVRVSVHVKEYKIIPQDMKKPILLNAKLNTKRDGDRLVADLELSGLGNNPFRADGSIPAHISLKPFAFDIDKSGKLEGKLLGKFDLAVLQVLPAMDGQNIRGNVDIRMGIEGSLEKWALNGGVDIRNARYENIEQGILLDRIEGRLDAQDRIIKLTRLSATDGGTGTISLAGQTDVDPPFQTKIALTMKQATLLRKETLSVTAGGNLDLKGNKDRMDLTGAIDLEKTEIAIPKSFPPDVPVIPVTVINDPEADTSKKSETQSAATPIRMDLTVNIPNQFFVRGRGLDVEFKGNLEVKGPVDNPVIRGSLNVVKGTFLFLSRTFNVTSGQIAFDGSSPPVPFLNINTEVDAGEITAKVNVSGPADAFKLKLSSQPTLPQDEIMAQILFGQSVAKLNTFQALQLAYSVNQLAGGYGPDVLGKTRSFLGLDRIGFSGGDEGGNSNDDEGNGPSVTLGKYVTDRVYVGVEQDLTDAKQDVIVEVDITPNLTVESKAGTRSGAGVGFNWNYDY